MKHNIIAIIFLAFAAVACSKGVGVPSSGNPEAAAESVEDSVTYLYGIPLDRYDMREGVVESGDYFSTILNNLGMPQNDVYELTEKTKKVYDVRSIRVGQTYHAFFSKMESDEDAEPRLEYFVYDKDNRSAVVFRTADTLGATILSKDYEVVQKYARVTIETSLWNDTQKAGFSPLLAIKLSDIYAWTIDFFGLQKGDSYEALYNEVQLDGKTMDVDEVVYAIFRHAGKEYHCYYFEEEGVSNRYWNEKGESLKKAFLKAPLQYFSRISSKFTYARRHPITRIVRPHTGVDYAAPTGTPVMSIGDGVVLEKGYKGGGGNTVKIKHNSTYTTAYLHLSRYASGLKVGSHVSQGQVIGYVGSTGASTGPHLDFRIWKNGTPVDPLKMESPTAEPLKAESLQKFEACRKQAFEQASEIVFRENYERFVISPLSCTSRPSTECD